VFLQSNREDSVTEVFCGRVLWMGSRHRRIWSQQSGMPTPIDNINATVQGFPVNGAALCPQNTESTSGLEGIVRFV
jgi:hypothetical protein